MPSVKKHSQMYIIDRLQLNKQTLTSLTDDNSDNHPIDTQNTSHNNWDKRLHNNCWSPNRDAANTCACFGSTISCSQIYIRQEYTSKYKCQTDSHETKEGCSSVIRDWMYCVHVDYKIVKIQITQKGHQKSVTLYNFFKFIHSSFFLFIFQKTRCISEYFVFVGQLYKYKLVMSWTAHDQFFGWIHSFRLNRNNYLLGGKIGTNDRPYPVIANNPSIQQVLNNWNSADTGLAITFALVGLLLARRVAAKEILAEGFVERRQNFKAYHRVFVAFGLFFASRNSAYRLQGYVPNGLPKQPAELVKYDYTSELINSTFWRWFFESHQKPNNL